MSAFKIHESTDLKIGFVFIINRGQFENMKEQKKKQHKSSIFNCSKNLDRHAESLSFIIHRSRTSFYRHM